MVEDVEEEEDKKPSANPVGKVMGDTMERPIGNRKAKKQKLLEKLDMSSVTSTAAIETMARSSAEMSQIMARRQKHDSLAKRAELYMKLGQEEKALELLAKMEEDDNKPFAIDDSKPKAAASVPTNIDINPDQFPEGGNPEQSDDDDVGEGNPTLKAACNPAFYSDDDSSSHPSQPSDDSRKVKKTPV